MKKQILALSTSAVLAACAAETGESPAIGMPNPASEYCVQQGGKLEMKQNKDGNEYALCHLPDGRVIEEWELFRSQK